MDILDDMGVSKLSAKVFLKVNYSFNCIKITLYFLCKKLIILNVISKRNKEYDLCKSTNKPNVF